MSGDATRHVTHVRAGFPNFFSNHRTRAKDLGCVTRACVRAVAWDNRTPKPFQPFGRSNVEMYRDKKLAQNWRVAVKTQIKKAKKLFDSDPRQDEGEAN
jgi:hypothetical protein